MLLGILGHLGPVGKSGTAAALLLQPNTSMAAVAVLGASRGSAGFTAAAVAAAASWEAAAAHGAAEHESSVGITGSLCWTLPETVA